MGGSPGSLDVVILCGGRGTRAYPDTVELPKPLLPVGGIPIVEQVMGIYAAQGHTRFVLAAGYRAELLADRYRRAPSGMTVEVIDTGLDTGTGERLRICADAVGGPRFFATYADGLGNVDLAATLDTHLHAGALVTMTTVPLPSQYGTVVFDAEGRVGEFREKPVLDDHWINAGFFVVEGEAFTHWRGEDLESEVLPALAATGRLVAHRHTGFWKSMDTYKDRQELERLACAGKPPWSAAA